MKIAVYSRTGNGRLIAKALSQKEGILEIQTGDEILEEDYLLITNTADGGKVPGLVSLFLEKNSSHLKAVVATGSYLYKDTFCKAGETISKQYTVPLLEKVDGRGDPYTIQQIKNKISLL